MENFLFARAEQDRVAFVESEVLVFEQFEVVLHRGRVLRQRCLAQLHNSCVHLLLVVFADRRHVVGLKLLVVGARVIRVAVMSLHVSLLPLALDLIEQGDVLVELNETNKRHEFAHNLLLEVHDHLEHALDRAAKHLGLLQSKLVVFSYRDDEWEFVCVIVQVNETIVEQESLIALLAVGIINLIASLNVFQCFNNETLSVVSVCPRSLAGALVVEHVSVGDKAIGFDSFDLNSENTTCNHHSHLRVLLEGELSVLGHLFADERVVSLNVLNLFSNYVLEGTSFQPGALFLSVENREVAKLLGQDVDVLVKVGAFLASFLHDVSGQEGVFRRDEPLAEVALEHELADRGGHCHLQSNDLFLWHVQNGLSLLDVSGSVDTSVVGGVVSDFHLVKLGSILLHPPEECFEADALRIINSYTVVLRELLLGKREHMLDFDVIGVNLESLFQIVNDLLLVSLDVGLLVQRDSFAVICLQMPTKTNTRINCLVPQASMTK